VAAQALYLLRWRTIMPASTSRRTRAAGLGLLRDFWVLGLSMPGRRDWSASIRRAGFARSARRSVLFGQDPRSLLPNVSRVARQGRSCSAPLRPDNDAVAYLLRIAQRSGTLGGFASGLAWSVQGMAQRRPVMSRDVVRSAALDQIRRPSASARKSVLL